MFTATTSRGRFGVPGIVFTVALSFLSGSRAGVAQTPVAAPAAAAARQLGTVKSISGITIMLSTDAAKTVTVTVADGARIVQLPPGSTDLKSAQVIALGDVAVGDRVLVSGKPGDSDAALTATRVILMKSTAIAEKHANEQDEWKKQGVSGIVSAANPGASGPSLTVSAGAKKFTVQTTSSTIFRRYAGDSVKFNDAKPGTADQIKVGDQLSVRGPKSDDGSSLTAVEIVSGSFRNLSGLLTAVDASAGTVTLKDLATKQTVKVAVTSNSDLRNLPEQAATRFAARAKGGDTTAAPTGASEGSAPRQSAGAHSAGGDLSQMLSRLPTQTVAELKSGDAVMIVVSVGQPGVFTAVTLLNGVEPILSATPSGSAPITLAPWSLGGGAPEGGGGAPQ